LGIKYEGKRFWFASLKSSTGQIISGSISTLPAAAQKLCWAWSRVLLSGIQLVNQRKAPAAYTLDFFGGKSWKINKVFLYLNVGVNNILDNKNIIVSGREAYLNAFGREFDNENLVLP
jgi:hypothetical protein